MADSDQKIVLPDLVVGKIEEYLLTFRLKRLDWVEYYRLCRCFQKRKFKQIHVETGRKHLIDVQKIRRIHLDENAAYEPFIWIQLDDDPLGEGLQIQLIKHDKLDRTHGAYFYNRKCVQVYYIRLIPFVNGQLKN